MSKGMTILLLDITQRLGRVVESHRDVQKATNDRLRGLRMSELRVDLRTLISQAEEAYELATEAEERIGAEDERVV